MAVARGQITIVDLNDAKTLNLYLSANHALTQIFNKENSSYVPNYSASGQALVITPELFVSGTATSVISQVKTAPVWKISGSTNLANFGATAATTAPYALTINRNMTNVAQMAIECEVGYTDPLTSVVSVAKSAITFTKTENAGQLICAIATAPKGTIFKQGGATSLQAKCDLWRGSSIDTTKVSYAWYKLSASGSWERLIAQNSYGCTGFDTNTLTIPATAVLNFESFKCDIKDIDSASGTFNTTVSDIISFADLTDPYQVVIVSPSGDRLVNGQGSLTLTAEVWQAGEVVADTAGSKFNYSWKRYDKDGRQDTAWGTSGVKTGRQLTVSASDVSVKATFICEIALK